jgi:hypothetical protein
MRRNVDQQFPTPVRKASKTVGIDRNRTVRVPKPLPGLGYSSGIAQRGESA